MKTKRSNKRWLPVLVMAMLLSMLFSMSAMAANKTVTMKKNGNGVYEYLQEKGYTGTVYHKITVPASGLISITGNGISTSGATENLNVVLCDSKKREISYSNYVNFENDRMISFGVKKGTYYLKAKTNGIYYLVAGITKMSDKGAATKAKAYGISQKKTVTGVLPVGEKPSKADWFKIKVANNKLLNINISAYCSGKVRFQIYGQSVKKGCTLATVSQKDGSYYVSKNGKPIRLKAGVYYIKVSRATRTASGVYEFKCQTE